jgi:hypothetical protein
MIRLLLINLTPEAEWVVWRAAQHVWGRCLCIQFVPDIETAISLLRQDDSAEQTLWPALVLLGTGAYGDWEPAPIEQLRGALVLHHIPLVGLADTSLALERLRARHAPLDAVILNPVQPDALFELAASLNLRSSLDCPDRNAPPAENKRETADGEGWRRLPMVASH